MLLLTCGNNNFTKVTSHWNGMLRIFRILGGPNVLVIKEMAVNSGTCSFGF